MVSNVILSCGKLISSSGLFVARGRRRHLAGRAAHRNDASVERLDGVGDLVLPVGVQATVSEHAQFDQVAALLLEDGKLLTLLDVVGARQACQPVVARQERAQAAPPDAEVHPQRFTPGRRRRHVGLGREHHADLRGDAMFIVDRRERLVELAAQRLGHDGGVAHGHAQALVAEHAADRLALHAVLPPLDGVHVAD